MEKMMFFLNQYWVNKKTEDMRKKNLGKLYFGSYRLEKMSKTILSDTYIGNAFLINL